MQASELHASVSLCWPHITDISTLVLEKQLSAFDLFVQFEHFVYLSYSLSPSLMNMYPCVHNYYSGHLCTNIANVSSEPANYRLGWDQVLND